MINDAKTFVAEKASWRVVLPVYIKLIQVERVNSEPRSKTLDYLMEVNLNLIKERKADEALELALELNKLIPSDFYIQNRIIAAYRVMAEDAMAKKDWKTAEELLYKKALSIRFDIEAMRTVLKLRMEQTREAMAAGDLVGARKYLDEAYLIVNIEENKPLYVEEAKQIEALAAQLNKFD